jgi:hypothetical protein
MSLIVSISQDGLGYCLRFVCLTVGTLLNPLPYLYTLLLVTYIMVIHLIITVSAENIIEATWKHVKVSICA